MRPVAFLIVFILVSSAPGVHAAGFDCKKPGTKVEKYICLDPDLSAADDRLSVLYKQALNKTNDREAFVKDQRAWLRKRDAVKDRNVLLKLYQDRIQSLQGGPITMSAVATASCSEFLKRNEIDRSDFSKCKVTATGNIGIFGGKTYSYTLYCITPPESDEICGQGSQFDKMGLSIYWKDNSSKTMKLFSDKVSSEVGMYLYDSPEVIKAKSGTFLHVPVTVSGTGNFNESDYYIWDEGNKSWRYLDAASWQHDLDKYVPKGTEITHSIWPNLQKMTAEVFLSRPNDPNCCPTGGKLDVNLAIKGDRFEVQSAKWVKDSD